jgi:hypothetical protein
MHASSSTSNSALPSVVTWCPVPVRGRGVGGAGGARGAGEARGVGAGGGGGEGGKGGERGDERVRGHLSPTAEAEVENTAAHCGAFAADVNANNAVPSGDIGTCGTCQRTRQDTPKHTHKHTCKHTHKHTCKHTYKDTSAAVDAPCALPVHGRGAAGEAGEDEV